MNEGIPGANLETRPDEPDDVSETIEVSHVAPLSDTLSAEYVPDNDQTGRGNNEMEFIWSFDGSSLTPAAANSSPAPVSAADATRILTLVTSSGDQCSKDEDLLDQILSGKPESPPVENNAAVWIRTEVSFLTKDLLNLSWRGSTAQTDISRTEMNTLVRKKTSKLYSPRDGSYSL
jgi:hypothetical protein